MVAMEDEGMAEEVKGLIKEGYSLEKIRANLVKIGYSKADADKIISLATGPVPDRGAAPPTKPPGAAENPLPQGEELAELKGGEETDEDLLLAADDSTPIAPPNPVKLPEVKPTAEEVPKHHGHHLAKPKAEVPKAMGEETKPRPGAGKAIAIIIIALIIIAIMAYFILLPKLGMAIAL